MTTTYWLGAHKTATTYLQKSLDLSGEVLEEHGLQYVQLDEFRDRWTRPLLNQDHGDEPAPADLDDERDLLVFDENIPGLVQHAIDRSGFYPDAEERVAAIVDHLGRPVDELVFGIRNYATYLPSLYCETLKSTPFRTFQDYLGVSFGDDGFATLNWYQLVRRLLDAHPDARMRIYVQEDLRGQEALLLEEVLGIPHEQFSMVQTSERIGFSHRAVDHLHLVNEHRTVEFNDVRDAVRRWPRSDGHAPFDPWDDEQRHALTTAYERDRAWIVADDELEVVRLTGVLDGGETARASAGRVVSTSSATAIPAGPRHGIAQPDLSVVVPVHDASDTVGGLVESLLAATDLDVQVVLVDDASTDGSGELLDELAASPRVVAMHHERNAGAGIARNTGLRAAIGRHTLFFDADDTIHVDALARVVAELDRSGADVAMTSYHYHRASQPDNTGMNTYDEETWADYLQGDDVRLGTLESLPRLLGFSNYPWNKVVRTDRYRDVGLRFGATPVHNDILGHWSTLLFARSILLLDDPVCTHVVGQTHRNLTNRHTNVRLRLFDALDETYDLLEANPALRNRYAHFYWSMVMRVSAWAASRIDRDHAVEFDHLLAQHLLRVNLTDYARIRTRRDPQLADAMLRRATS